MKHSNGDKTCHICTCQETEDLVTFTEEILNGKLNFLCSESCELTNITKKAPS